MVVQEPPTYLMEPPTADCDVQKRLGELPVAYRKLQKRRRNVPTGYWNGLGWPVFAGAPGDVGSKYSAGTFRQAVGTFLQPAGSSRKVSGTSQQPAGSSKKVSGTSQQTAGTSIKLSGTSRQATGTPQAGSWIYLKKPPQIEELKWGLSPINYQR
jgi:hypothetical protein